MCESCEKAKALLQEWLDKQGHDRCWYYPEIFKELVVAYNLKPTKESGLPPRKEFELGCTKYQEEEYKRSHEKVE